MATGRPAFAAGGTTGPFAEQVVSLLKSRHMPHTIDQQIPLYDGSNQIAAWGFSLSPQGYTILDLQGNPVEYSFTNDSPFSPTERTYYTGPLGYHVKTGEGEYYRNLITQESVSAPSLKFASTVFKQTAENSARQRHLLSAASSSYYTYTLPHATHTYSYNPDGRCGSVAAAIWLMYYDECLNDNTVPPLWSVATVLL